MKITVTKIKRELENNYAWIKFDSRTSDELMLSNLLISDTLKVINDIILKQKGFTINK